jgi:uncharacterized OB-fold protein
MSRPGFRVMPAVTPENEHFWTGGAEGELRFQRCTACGTLVHPPAPVCPACLARTFDTLAVSGRGTVFSYTINHQPWVPGFDPPYVVAIVEIDEQPDVRLTTNLVGIAPDAVEIGMAVQVCFEQWDDVWVPLFEPVAGSTRSPEETRSDA